MEPQSPRDLQESEEFSKKRAQLFTDTKLYDDVTFAITFTVAKSPSTFPFVPETTIQVAQLRSTPSTPALSIFFIQKNENVIELIDILEDQE